MPGDHGRTTNQAQEPPDNQIWAQVGGLTALPDLSGASSQPGPEPAPEPAQGAPDGNA